MSQGTRIRLARSHLPEFPGVTSTHVAARTSLLSIYWIRNLRTMARAYARFCGAVNMNGVWSVVSDADRQERKAALLFGFGDDGVKVSENFRN